MENNLKQLNSSAALGIALGFILVCGLALILFRTLGLSFGFVVQSLLCFTVIAGGLWIILPQHLPQRHFGIANSITLGRAVVVALLAGLIGHPGDVVTNGWWLLGFAAIALLLDGVDGWMARRSGMRSPFGARFDMEVDALFILVLAILVYQTGKADPWVLLNGFLRYLFVAAGFAVPALRRPLPPSKWRQAICVVQVAVLALCLAPMVTPTWSKPLAAGALVLLALSFSKDTLWLTQHAKDSGG